MSIKLSFEQFYGNFSFNEVQRLILIYENYYVIF